MQAITSEFTEQDKHKKDIVMIHLVLTIPKTFPDPSSP